MRRSCGCPYVHTSCKSKPTACANKNEPITKSRSSLESRPALRDVQNRLGKKAPACLVTAKKKSSATATASSSSGATSKKVEIKQVPAATTKKVEVKQDPVATAKKVEVKEVEKVKAVLVATAPRTSKYIELIHDAPPSIATESIPEISNDVEKARPAPKPATISSSNAETQTSFKIIIEPKETERVCETENQTPQLFMQITNSKCSLPTTTSNASFTPSFLSSLKSTRLNFRRKYETPAIDTPILSTHSGFMCAAEFFTTKRNHDRIEISPIKANVELDQDIVVSMYNEDKAPAQKKTLLRAKRARLNRNAEKLPYTLDIYTTEYLPEIIKSLMIQDQMYLVKRNYLLTCNSHLSYKDRIQVLDWILKIQSDIRISTPVYYMVVRLLDNILADIIVPRNMLQLIGIVTCWILMKRHDRSIPTGNVLATLCANAYSTKQIFHMEKKLLCYTNFDLNVSTPCDFFHIHLKYLNVPLDHGFVHCIHYILELFSLNERFSTYPSSEIASALTYLSLKYFEWNTTSRLNACIVYHPYSQFGDIVHLMDVQLKRIYKSPISEHELNIYKKYASPEYLKISVELKRRIHILV